MKTEISILKNFFTSNVQSNIWYPSLFYYVRQQRSTSRKRYNLFPNEIPKSKLLECSRYLIASQLTFESSFFFFCSIREWFLWFHYHWSFCQNSLITFTVKSSWICSHWQGENTVSYLVSPGRFHMLRLLSCYQLWKVYFSCKPAF